MERVHSYNSSASGLGRADLARAVRDGLITGSDYTGAIARCGRCGNDPCAQGACGQNDWLHLASRCPNAGLFAEIGRF